LSFDELRRLAELGVTLVTCPRGNMATGAGAPPIQRFYESGVAVAMGTDSLASVDDLNMFNELPWMRRFAPSVPPAKLLASATRVGADALGMGADYGAIEPGRRARLLAIDIPAGEKDVEEYLVRGVMPEQIRWIEC
jgi:cytosine/adenosine deaminase-related metal-dependent hydrolase